MAIQISIPTNAEVDARLESYRVRANVDRVVNGLPEYVSVDDMVEQHVKQILRTWIKTLFESDVREIQAAFVQATDAQQAAVRSALGL